MYLIGIDPEVFVVNKKSKDIVPSIGLIGGSKHFPMKVNKGALQEDNVMAEFNIDPAGSLKEFNENIEEVLGHLDARLATTGHEYDKTFKTSHDFSSKDLKDPQALQFGCDPDFNAYTLDKNPIIDPKMVGNFRMCGGHIHLGFPEADSHPMVRVFAARWMDILVGAPLSKLDPDSVRKNFYGKAGNFRIKDYGIEYRTPSNFWLSSKNLIEFVWHSSILAATRAVRLESPRAYDGGRYSPDSIRRIIDSAPSEIDSMLHRFKVSIPSIGTKK